jgi:hypothetical protein
VAPEHHYFYNFLHQKVRILGHFPMYRLSANSVAVAAMQYL